MDPDERQEIPVHHAETPRNYCHPQLDRWQLWVPAAIGLAVAMLTIGFKTSDRFTGAQGATLNQRVFALEAAVRQLPPDRLLNQVETQRQEIVSLRETVVRLETALARKLVLDDE